MQDDLGISYLFIAHDLAVVRHVADDVAVMYLGRLVEKGSAEALFARPMHPYTLALLSIRPIHHMEKDRLGERIVLRGEIPGPAAGAAWLPVPGSVLVMGANGPARYMRFRRAVLG